MVAANGIYRLSVVGTVNGQQHIHTLHFRSTVDPDGLAMSETAYQQGLIDAWQASGATSYRGCFYTVDSPVQTLQARKVCGSLPLPGGVDELSTTGNILGTRNSSSEALAPWLAGVTTLRTAFQGRSYRGRSFLGGLNEIDVQSATLQGTYLTAVGVYFAALKTAFVDPADVDNPFRLFVFSRKLAQTEGIACQNAGGDVVSYAVRNTLATMKSRKAGSGL